MNLRTSSEPKSDWTVKFLFPVLSSKHTTGCGSAGTPPEALPALPARVPDQKFAIAIPARAALPYQRNRDTNSIHSDPEAARKAGFDAPILHGLCSFGYAGHAITAARPGRLTEIGARFTAIVHSGEDLQLDFWHEDEAVRFSMRMPARDATALDRGIARLA